MPNPLRLSISIYYKPISENSGSVFVVQLATSINA